MSLHSPLTQALRAVCADLAQHDPNAASLHFARGVMAAGSIREFKGPRPPREPRPPKNYTGKHADKAKDIVAAYCAGSSALDVATRFGCDPALVRRMVVEAGEAMRPPSRASEKAPSPRIEQIMAMRAAGKTGEEIGEALGITRERVRQIVIKEGMFQQYADRPFRPEEITAFEEYKAGAPLGIVAAMLGVTPDTAKKKLIAAGVELRPKPRANSAESARRVQEASALHREGLKPRAIAEAMGLPHLEYVYRYLAKAGIKTGKGPN